MHAAGDIMRKTLLLAVLGLSTTLTASAKAGDDELFSPLRLGSTSSSTGRAASTDTRPQPLSNAAAVQTLLLAAGYNARIDERDTLRIEISRGEWTAPVVIGLADAGRELRMAMRLTEPEANTIIAPRTLREMLQANRSNWSAFFAIAGEPQRIELVKTISNNGLDSEQFRDELDKLADMADKTQKIWKSEGVRIRQATEATESDSTETATPAPSTAATPNQAPATTAPSTPATPAPAPTQPDTNSAAPATSSLAGKWIATPTTNEAFALQIDADSSFKLVHVKGTKSTKSKGTWTLAGTTLTLKGDDSSSTTITGTIARQSDSFTLTMTGAGGKSINLTFKSGT
jgi:hypothetical protein